MHDTFRKLHGGRKPHAGQHGSGTTINRVRLYELLAEILFAGRRGRVYRRIVSLAGVKPGDCVLDVGCNGGYLVRKLAMATGPAGRVTGVDPSEAAIAYARRGAAPGTTFVVGVAQELDLPDASFDVITCTLAMHHVPVRSRQTAFREMYRVTKPGGRLLVADFDPVRRRFTMHPRVEHMRRAAVAAGPLEDLASAAGWQVAGAGNLPLLNYILVVRPND